MNISDIFVLSASFFGSFYGALYCPKRGGLICSEVLLPYEECDSTKMCREIAQR